MEREFEHIQIVDNGRIVCDPGWITKIEAECDRILGSGHRFAQNYSLEQLQLQKHLSFDVLSHKNNVVTWAGLFNGGRYPDGVFRIMNRLYISPEYRSHSCAYTPYARKYILPIQTKRYQNHIRKLFLSREGLKAKFFLKRWVKYNAPERDWKISDHLIKVAPSEKRSCYQFIAYRDYVPVDWHPKTLDEYSWTNLPI